MKELKQYMADLIEIQQECLKLLPHGTLDWPAYKNDPFTEANYRLSREMADVEIEKIQENYILNLLKTTNNRDYMYKLLIQDKQQYVLRKRYALLSVKLVKKYGVAGCHEMTQLVMVKIKELFPELIVHFAFLKYYDHAFVIIENPDNQHDQLVFDLYAAGLEKPVIFPLAQLQQNMARLELNKITQNHITEINKKHIAVWRGESDAPKDTYGIKLTLKSNELFLQPAPAYSKSSLCATLGILAATTVVAGVSWYLVNSTEDNTTANLTP